MASNRDSRELIEKYTTKSYLLKDYNRKVKYVKQFDAFRPVIWGPEQPIKFSSYVSREELLLKNRVSFLDLVRYVNIQIEGKFLLCRTLTSPLIMTIGVVLIADEPESELAVRVAVYNSIHPIQNKKNIAELLPVGTIMAIRNPLYAESMYKGYELLIVNPADVTLIKETQFKEYFPGLKWTSEIPKTSVDKSTPGSTVDKWKVLGNKYFYEKNYFEALKAYSTGLKENPHSAVLLSNRAATYLQLDAYEMALNDVIQVLKIDRLHAKAVFRKVKALCGLKRYKEALAILDKIKCSDFNTSDFDQIMELKSKVELYLHQSQTGDYDFAFMLSQALTNCRISFDYADYAGPLEVRQSLGRGRGLFATENIKAGQLLIGSKAFALHVPEGGCRSIKMSVKWNSWLKVNAPVVERDIDAITSLVIKILTMAPEKGKELYKLYAGPDLKFLSPENGDKTNLIDSKRIQQICTFNAFPIWMEQTVKLSNEGIWILPSYINHSCYDSNCNWMVFGDFMVIRSFKPIAKNEEILISYFRPDSHFSQRIDFFETYRFLCDCRLCETEHKVPKKVHQKRETLSMGMGCSIALLQVTNTEIDISTMNYYLRRLSDLGKKSPELNFYLLLPLVALGTTYNSKKQYAKASEYFEKMYELTKGTVLCYSNIKVLTLLLTACLNAGAIEKAKKWIKELRETVLLTFGTLEVSDVIEHVVRVKQLMKEKGLSM